MPITGLGDHGDDPGGRCGLDLAWPGLWEGRPIQRASGLLIDQRNRHPLQLARALARQGYEVEALATVVDGRAVPRVRASTDRAVPRLEGIPDRRAGSRDGVTQRAP